MNYSRTSLILSSAVSMLFFGFLAITARSATITLHDFTGSSNDGDSPTGSLSVFGSKIYGTTYYGGSVGNGTLFSMNTDGTGFNLLHDFLGNGTIGIDDGFIPVGSPTLSGSQFYGMTAAGGSSGGGIFYGMNTNGTGYSKLHFFGGGANDGSEPVGSPTLSGSKVYGMTVHGGSSNSGTIFGMNSDGTGFSLLHSFNATIPVGSLVLSGPKLFGMTRTGNLAGDTIFSMNTDGTGYAQLHIFNGGAGDGAQPLNSLTLVGSKLFGMTNYGGPSNSGVLFSINTDGTGFSLLHSFIGGANDGQFPTDSLTIFGSKLYGATQYGGTSGAGIIFGINIDGTGFSALEHLNPGGPIGTTIAGDIAFSANGSTLYSTTRYGGSVSKGTIFSSSLSVPEPATSTLLCLSALLVMKRQRRT